MPPTNREMDKEQRESLYDLLMIQESDDVTKALNNKISRTMAGMTKEEIAWVEKMVERSKKDR